MQLKQKLNKLSRKKFIICLRIVIFLNAGYNALSSAADLGRFQQAVPPLEPK